MSSRAPAVRSNTEVSFTWTLARDDGTVGMAVPRAALRTCTETSRRSNRRSKCRCSKDEKHTEKTGERTTGQGRCLRRPTHIAGDDGATYRIKPEIEHTVNPYRNRTDPKFTEPASHSNLFLSRTLAVVDGERQPWRRTTRGMSLRDGIGKGKRRLLVAVSRVDRGDHDARGHVPSPEPTPRRVGLNDAGRDPPVLPRGPAASGVRIDRGPRDPRAPAHGSVGGR